MRSTQITARSLRRRVFPALALSVAVFMSLAMGDCPVSPSDSECGDSEAADSFELAGSEMFTAPFPTRANRDGGQAIFEWDRDVSGLCVESPESDNSVLFTLGMNSVTPDMTFEGQVHLGLAFVAPRTVSLTSTTNRGGIPVFQGTVGNIGLRQANPLGGAAKISNVLRVSMNSSGNIDTDLARARSLVSSFSIRTQYTAAK